jgi:hypothetical protein
MVRKQIALREDEDILKKLARQAKAKGISVSDIIRIAIRFYLEHEKANA